MVLLGEVLFAFLALRISKEHLIEEMQNTLIDFSRATAFDISRGYDIENTRSLYSFLDELQKFDKRILSLSVVDTNGIVTADIDLKRILSPDTTSLTRLALFRNKPIVNFDEQERVGICAVPIVLSHQKKMVGVFVTRYSIGTLYSVFDSLEQGIVIISTLVVLFLMFGITYINRTIIVQPMKKILPVLQKIQSGDFSHTVPVKNEDEINVLAQHVNDMATGLKEREFVKDTFSRYVPKEVVDQLMERKIRPRLEGELRDVTVFFSDIRGFTEKTERLGAEQIVYILNRYFTAMTEVVLQYDGMLDKFSGDEMMVVFGAPLVHNDDPFRAVEMGLTMQERLKNLNEEFSREGIESIGIGIGINTGKAIAGNIGSEKRLNYSVIGDDVNLASRLVSQAKAGEIIISEETHEIVKQKFVCEALGEVQVKGKSKSITIFRVLESTKK
jgi:class 3 adenylate cyclase